MSRQFLIDNAKRYHAFGQTNTLRGFAEAYGLKRATLYNRLAAGHPVEEALTRPVGAKMGKPHILVEYDGVKVRFVELCQRLGVNDNTIRYRLRIGMPLHEALTKPIRQLKRRTPSPKRRPGVG